MSGETNRGDAALSLLPTEPQAVPKQREGGVLPSHCTLSSFYRDPADSNGVTDSLPSSEEGNGFFGRVRVVVRCRPLHSDTETNHSSNRVQIHGNDVIVHNKVMYNDARSYHFDRVLPPEADQSTMFGEVAPLADHVLDGFHASVFAYGQTGSGKTYTMDGFRYTSTAQQRKEVRPDVEGTPVEEHGVMPRIIQLLFDRARERQRAVGVEDMEARVDADSPDEGLEFTFRCSYYQIYNEKITDLLRGSGVLPAGSNSAQPPSSSSLSSLPKMKTDSCRIGNADHGDLRVRWHKGDVFKVENLFICTCSTPDEMRAVFLSGLHQKVVRGHLLNHQSSRSHCVFTIYVERRARRNGELLSRSELSLVDLAGSEKLSLLSHNPSTKLVKESIDINTSLLSLGKVITALGSAASATTSLPRKKNSAPTPRAGGRPDQKAGVGHIPYRESKLTMLLKHALGGNSLTIMIACISPSDRYVEETVSTLLYAGRAKNIRNTPRVNEDATTLLIRQLREEIAQLNMELGYYREMAAKALVKREGNTNVCEHCSGVVCATSPGSVSEPSPVAGATAMTVATEQDLDQLSESLVTACGMLTNLMQVNAQLRESYDTLRELQNAAERREAALNAENLALRERLALLEAIVLQDEEDMDGSDEDKEVDEAEAYDAQVSVDNTPPLLEQESTSNKKSVDAHVPNGTFAAETQRTAAAAPLHRVNGIPHGGHPAERYAAAEFSTQNESTSSSPVEPPASLKKEYTGKRRAGDSVPCTDTWVSTVQASVAGPSTMAEQLSSVLCKMSDNGPSCSGVLEASSKPPAGNPAYGEERRLSYGQKKTHTRKRYGGLASRLKEYKAQYHTLYAIQTYADYYKQPTRRKSTAPLVPGVPPIRASDVAAPQVTAALREMKMIAAKLPVAVVPEYVPTSLLQPGSFGSLAFGGNNTERAPFEQNRTAREERLRAMQRCQEELYRQVRSAVYGASCEDQANTANARLGDAGQEKPKSSGTSTSASPFRAAIPLYAPQTGHRLGTASPCKSSRPQRSYANLDSMARLVEYLERGK
ncbi:hypothetical protein JKF63_01761 [Porcisia hertigi]|uniref:Kinesin motor domain-containing protein n=1 Tax=Porcisia hertigi TaxID=2761500 RepID=A0A836HLR6_9TRYP|nr:hypothetical protein JKF63_01761 [Porcisia hertigi]